MSTGFAAIGTVYGVGGIKSPLPNTRGFSFSSPVVGGVKVSAETGFTFTKTAAKHFDDIIVKNGWLNGKPSRPYMNSPLTIREIIATGKGLPDASAKGALSFKVPGRFRGSKGTWELVVDPVKRHIYHFNFVN
jgi:hypothetical protein